MDRGGHEERKKKQIEDMGIKVKEATLVELMRVNLGEERREGIRQGRGKADLLLP